MENLFIASSLCFIVGYDLNENQSVKLMSVSLLIWKECNIHIWFTIQGCGNHIKEIKHLICHVVGYDCSTEKIHLS